MDKSRFALPCALLAAVLAIACHSDLFNMARLMVALRSRFGGEAVAATLTENGNLFIAFQDRARSARDSLAQLAFADSVAGYVVDWFERRKRLSSMTFHLARSASLQDTRQVTFVPEYEPDGSFRLKRIGASPQNSESERLVLLELDSATAVRHARAFWEAYRREHRLLLQGLRTSSVERTDSSFLVTLVPAHAAARGGGAVVQVFRNGKAALVRLVD